MHISFIIIIINYNTNKNERKTQDFIFEDSIYMVTTLYLRNFCRQLCTVKQRKIEFSDLCDEIILIICSYLTPQQVLKTFINLNERFYQCIAKYCRNNQINLHELIINNFRFHNQIEHFKSFKSLTIYPSLLERPNDTTSIGYNRGELVVDKPLDLSNHCLQICRLTIYGNFILSVKESQRMRRVLNLTIRHLNIVPLEFLQRIRFFKINSFEDLSRNSTSNYSINSSSFIN